ncbi:MAG: hypothetical protein WAU82_11250, partial [Candidatus Binatus sp.]|uniref:hypothetical protein n=1 Tax=Candidatus Binatus sp. TaxID=2811406 RepID=UPI003BB0D6B7
MSIVLPTGRFFDHGSAVLAWLLGFLLTLSTTTLGVSLLLRPVVRTRFQFVGFAGVAVEVENFLSVSSHDIYSDLICTAGS